MKTGTSKRRLPSNRTNFTGKAANPRVAELLARYYLSLRDKLCKGKHGNVLSMSYEDIFHTAIIWTIQDKNTIGLNDEEILQYFEKRYRSTEMEIRRDNKLLKQTEYADDIQTEAPETE